MQAERTFFLKSFKGICSLTIGSTAILTSINPLHNCFLDFGQYLRPAFNKNQRNIQFNLASPTANYLNANCLAFRGQGLHQRAQMHAHTDADCNEPL